MMIKAYKGILIDNPISEAKVKALKNVIPKAHKLPIAPLITAKNNTTMNLSTSLNNLIIVLKLPLLFSILFSFSLTDFD